MARFQRLRNIFSKKTELLIIFLSAWYKNQLSIFGSYARHVHELFDKLELIKQNQFYYIS